MRIFKAVLLCGASASALAAWLYHLGAFAPWTQAVFGAAGGGPAWAQSAAAAALGFGLAWTTLKIDAMALKLVTAVAALAEVAVLSWVLFLFGVAWAPFTALAAGVAGFALGLAYGWTAAGRRARALARALGGRVSRTAFERMVRAGVSLPLAGEEREASVLVCRLLNRRELAEALAAEDFVALSNAFCHAASQAVLEAGGVLTEADGSHVEAVFGVPLGTPPHAEQAALAALELALRLDDFRHQCALRWGVEPDARVAVNSGTLIAGMYGAGALAGFGVAGLPLESCRRLCRMAERYGVRVIAGPETFRLARRAVEARPIDLLWEEGVREEIYELLGTPKAFTPEARHRRDAFWIAVILFRGGQSAEAAALFWTLSQDTDGAEDGLIQYYLNLLKLPTP